MKRLFKFLKVILSLGFVLSVITGLFWILPERTPKIKTDDKKAISTIDYIHIGGIEQCVLIRSHNTDNPIILFLHGGPGMPMMYMGYKFQRPLEKNFTVVQWDRRGAGKTFSRNVPIAESMNVRQILDDAYTLIDTLKTRYRKEKIILVGHSFGTYLGSIMVYEKPELFSGYISVGQVVDDDMSRKIQEQFIKENATKNNRKEIITELEKPVKPNFENWLFEFGGELKNSKSFLPFIWTGLKAPEYTMKDAFNVAKGSSFSSVHMNYNVLDSSIYYKIRDYQVPVYFFVGKSDYVTPHVLIENYFNLINAPTKNIVYFENSAHFPFFEEPEKFCDQITKNLNPDLIINKSVFK